MAQTQTPKQPSDIPSSPKTQSDESDAQLENGDSSIRGILQPTSTVTIDREKQSLSNDRIGMMDNGDEHLEKCAVSNARKSSSKCD
jgi:hypothetical protein